MHRSRRVVLALMTMAVLVGSAMMSTSAFADPVVPNLTTSVDPSVPTDPVLHGVSPGSAPWVIKASVAQLNEGLLAVSIQGLVIPELGTPGPVTSVDAALYCGEETKPALTTKTFPLSEKGNALITERVKLPATCLTPAVLINPLGIGSIYIATGGFPSGQFLTAVRELAGTEHPDRPGASRRDSRLGAVGDPEQLRCADHGLARGGHQGTDHP